MKELLYSIVEYGSNIVDMMLCYLVLRPICNIDKKRKRAVVGVICISQVMELCDYLIDNDSPLILLFAITLYTLWGIMNTKKENRKMVLFRVILTAVIMTVSNGLCIAIPILFGNIQIDMIKYPSIIRTVMIIVSSLFSFAMIQYILPFLEDKTITKYTSFFYVSIALFVLHILSYYCCVENVIKTEYLQKKIHSNMLVCMLILAILMLIMLYIIVKILHESQKVSQIKDQNYLQRKIIQQQKKAIGDIRQRQHEYKNNIESIHALLLSQNVDKADSFVGKLLNQNIYTDKMIRNNETFAQIILGYKLKEATQKYIKILQNVDLCNDIPIDEYDLALVINNAMNNAIESCEKLPISMRYIKCMICIKLKYLNFYFENACASNLDIDDDNLTTSKNNSSEHGFGVQNITSIVKKYNGFIKYYSKNGVFYLNFSLLIPDCKST